MEVDEVPRSSGRFKLNRVAQEHMNEGLEVWIQAERVPSVRSLDTQPIRPTLKELQDRLQSRTRDDSAREERPPTWRDHPFRNVIIASYKKNTDGAYHRHNRMDWTTAERARRGCFHDDAWAQYFTQPRIPEGAVH